MNWVAFVSIAISVVQTLLENCPDEEPLEGRRGWLRTPAERHKRRFETALKREATNPFTGCVSRREWRQNENDYLDYIYSQAASMTDFELDQIIGVD